MPAVLKPHHPAPPIHPLFPAIRSKQQARLRGAVGAIAGDGRVGQRFSNRAVDGVRVGAWKLRGREGVELFDLESDPAERYNCAEEFPERVAELKARIETMAAAVPGNRKRG